MPQDDSMSKYGERLHPFDHALKRPDTYIGSITTSTQEQWILTEERAVRRKMRYNPGLFNIIREIVSNAIDNKWRSDKNGIPMRKIEVSVNLVTGEISVLNDGDWILAEQRTYKYTDYRTGKTTEDVLYPAEIFFGEMLAGTNFDDTQERKTSGKNGMGAKATNVFSTSFIVEHTDPTHKRKFVQAYSDNGKTHTSPEVTPYRLKTGYTKITFTPDYERFGAEMDEDMVSLLRLYCCEASMITGLPVTFTMVREEGEESAKLLFRDLAKFVKLFYDTKNLISLRVDTPGESECVVVEGDEPDTDQMTDIQHISYVNGIRTKDGGVHVEAWRDSIVGPLVRAFNSRTTKRKTEPLKTTAKQLYPYFIMFVRVELDKPAFDSQTKDRLNAPTPTTSKPSPADLSKMLKWHFVARLEEKLRFYQERQLQRKEGTKRRILGSKKLTDANEAGGKRSLECVLFITEGNSAKSLAESFCSYLPGGADLNGAFALMGKPLNVTTASPQDILDCKEIQELQSALGLIPHTDYSDARNKKMLRYGKVNFFADADDDGYHIRGLLANFFWMRYPSLWSVGHFSILAESTPVVKVFPTKTSTVCSLVFYTNADYKAWHAANATGKERSLYYKGLGSIPPTEVPDLVQRRKTVEFYLEGDEKTYMSLAFAGEESDWRKQWITRDMDEGTDVYTEPAFTYEGRLGLSTFVDTNLLQYSHTTLARALPSVIDGFKEGPRKLFYGLMQTGLTAESKLLEVQRAALAASSKAGYHHGGKSAEDTITRMAQGFVGSNNVPLLVNRGQFGTRKAGGADAAASRYTKTYVDPFTAAIFSPDDDAILRYLEDDGHPAEPQFYVPILPMFLINGKAKAKGSGGIATGFSTKCPPFNPLDIANWIEAWLDDKHRDLPQLVPWWRGFTGDVSMTTTVTKGKEFDRVIIRGKMEKMEKGKFKGWWRITELPVGVWTNDVREMLEKLTAKVVKEVTRKGAKTKVEKPALVKEVRQYNGDNTVDMYFLPMEDFEPDMDARNNPLSVLVQGITLSNIVGLDRYGYPRHYHSAEEVLEYYCPIRLEFYEARKKWLLASIKDQYERATNKHRFVEAVKAGTIDMNQDDEALEAAMTAAGLKKMTHTHACTEESFEYLLSMHLRTIMSKTKGAELRAEAAALKAKMEALKKKSVKDMWREDLAHFRTEYPKWLKTRHEEPKR